MNNNNNFPNEMDPELLKQIMADPQAMVVLTKRSFLYFFYIYFGSYIEYPIAPFHREMFRLAEDEKIKRFGIISFRNSAKSTILNTAYALWAIMGVPQKKHIVIASQTQQRVRDHSDNIAREIEKNPLLRRYLGPFLEKQERWSTPVRVIPRYDARITFISAEEGIRGLREGPHRPDLIIVDDIENTESIKTHEGRKKTFNWLTGELLPLGNPNTKVVFIGNLLHEDCSLMKIKKMMDEGKMEGKFLVVPLIDDAGNIAWPGMFPSLEAVEKYKNSLGNEIAWQREFLLRIVSPEDQIIRKEWLKDYDVMPNLSGKDYMGTFIGVDPAGSESGSADCTAIIMISVFGENENRKIYVYPNPFNERVQFNETKERVILLSKSTGGSIPATAIVEDVATQKWLIQELIRVGVKVEPFPVGGVAKRARLTIAASLFQAGQVYFPRQGTEKLKQQLVGFGIEKYDDLADALAMILLYLMNLKKNKIAFFTADSSFNTGGSPIIPEDDNLSAKERI